MKLIVVYFKILSHLLYIMIGAREFKQLEKKKNYY